MAVYRDYKFKSIIRGVNTIVYWRIHKGNFVIENDPKTDLPISVYRRTDIDEDRITNFSAKKTDLEIRTALNIELATANTLKGYDTIPKQINS